VAHGPVALLAFCPSSGIGLYAVDGVVHGFDLVTEEDNTVQDARDDGALRIAGFASRSDLLAFVTTEYLRDKKQTCYSTLITDDVDAVLRDEILQFLDDEELTPTLMEDVVVTTLRENGSPSRVWRCLRRAEVLGCSRGVDCSRTTFPGLLGPPRIVRQWPAPPPLMEQHAPAALTRPAKPQHEASHWVPLLPDLPAYEPDTERYVTALVAGDHGVQEHFFAEFGRRLQRQVPPSLLFMAEDLVLNALVSTLESIKRRGLKEPWHLRAYARRALEHCIVDELRKRERYVPLGKHLLPPVSPAVRQTFLGGLGPIRPASVAARGTIHDRRSITAIAGGGAARCSRRTAAVGRTFLCGDRGRAWRDAASGQTVVGVRRGLDARAHR